MAQMRAKGKERADLSSPAEVSDWRPDRLPVEQLVLDTRNPRLATSIPKQWTQEELLFELCKSSNVFQIAESISAHGFFDSEPLIAILEDGHHVVVEGNRRLAALRILLDPNLRSRLPRGTGSWKSLDRGKTPDEVPVVIVESRESVIPLLGYRHISGIEPWDPIAQARYISSLVEDVGLSLPEIAQKVGRDLTEVRSMYRNHEILRQAHDQFGLNVKVAEDNFGIFTAAMGRTKLRAYIGAPDPANVDPNYYPLSESARSNTKQLLTYLFGDESGNGRVVTDSRQIKDLVEVLSDETGRGEQALRINNNLHEAIETVRQPADKFLTHLNTAVRALSQAEAVLPERLGSGQIRRIREIQDSVQRLLANTPPGVVR